MDTNIHEANWEQSEDGFKLASPLNIETKGNGEVRLYTADGKFDQRFEDSDQATEAINALLQRGTQTS